MNSICNIFQIKYPIVAGGMVWCSGWRLASAVSNAGGLGLIGAGSMHPDTFREHIQKAKKATSSPFGVNIPLLYPQQDELMNIVIEEKVPIVFTSAGSPKKWTPFLKERGVKVAHVVSSAVFAQKSEAAGVDAIVAEGFEAGGHDGKEETTTLSLVPSVRKVTSLPLLAAGGIATGEQMAAAMVLGADGVQIGSLFAASVESSAHIRFKEEIVRTKEGDTRLMLKQLAPVRLIKNEFYNKVEEAELRGDSKEELKDLLGQKRAKKGMFEGDLIEGELEIGQSSAFIDEIKPVGAIICNLLDEFHRAMKKCEKGFF